MQKCTSAHAPARCLSLISLAAMPMLSLWNSLHLFYILSQVFSQSPLCNHCRVEVASTSRKLLFSSSLTHSLSRGLVNVVCACLSFILFFRVKELQRHNLSTQNRHISPHKNTRTLTFTQSAALPLIIPCMHPTKYSLKHSKTHNSMSPFWVPVTNIRLKKKN